LKVILTCQPALGHFHPLVPLARALEDAGHEARFATSLSFVPVVEQAGFEGVGVGLDWLESEASATFPDAVGDGTDWHAMYHGWDAVFARAARRLVPDLVRLCRSARPDLVISESIEFSGPLAAEAARVPHVLLGIGACKPLPVLARAVGRNWNMARKGLQLPPDPGLERLSPYLYLDAYPPSMQPLPIADMIPAARRIRPVPFEVGDATLPPWFVDLHARRTVYVTMGTVFNRLDDVFAPILAALDREEVNVILTVGPNRDPAELGPQPEHVRLERYVRNSAVVPRVDAVVSHGGYNTMIAALTAGIPMLCLPLGADQFYNAFRLAAAGAGIRLDRSDATPARIQAAVRELLDEPLFRQNAERLGREIGALPPPREAVPLLERVAAAGAGSFA
jgi:UDP:flavonoid glycosyltransferase YjiC (YdhE family)